MTTHGPLPHELFLDAWHSRGYLPHFDMPGLVQSITFRLGDAVPRDVLELWRVQLANGSGGAELRRRVALYEDEGHGSCVLGDPRAARVVEGALLHFDGQRYRLLAWCVMPTHVHALIETRQGFAVGRIVQAWKSFSARTINEALGRTGSLWMPDYFDRYIRDEEHLASAIAYIERNPVEARLVSRPEDWEFSSARRRRT